MFAGFLKARLFTRPRQSVGVWHATAFLFWRYFVSKPWVFRRQRSSLLRLCVAMLPALVIGALALLPSSWLSHVVSVAFGAPEGAAYADDTLAAPPESLSLVADAHNPLWRTRYGTELGRQLLPARAPDFPQVPDAYEPPLVGTWLTRTIQSGSVWTRAIVGVPDGRVFAAINGAGLRVFTPSIVTGAYF